MGIRAESAENRTPEPADRSYSLGFLDGFEASHARMSDADDKAEYWCGYKAGTRARPHELRPPTNRTRALWPSILAGLLLLDILTR
jgi:hypothetical protein